MNKFLSKSDFIRCINDLKKIEEFHDGMDKLFKKHDVDGYFYPPDCTDTVVYLLHKIFGEKDFEEWIDYFIFSLGYGKNWKPGLIKDKDGNDIPLQTPEQLYDILCGSEVNLPSANSD